MLDGTGAIVNQGVRTALNDGCHLVARLKERSGMAVNLLINSGRRGHVI